MGINAFLARAEIGLVAVRKTGLDPFDGGVLVRGDIPDLNTTWLRRRHMTDLGKVLPRVSAKRARQRL